MDGCVHYLILISNSSRSRGIQHVSSCGMDEIEKEVSEVVEGVHVTNSKTVSGFITLYWR